MLFPLQEHFDASAANFENIVAKREMAHDEQFLNLPQCLQLYAVIIFSFLKIFHIIALMYSFAADCCMLEKYFHKKLWGFF